MRLGLPNGRLAAYLGLRLDMAPRGLTLRIAARLGLPNRRVTARRPLRLCLSPDLRLCLPLHLRLDLPPWLCLSRSRLAFVRRSPWFSNGLLTCDARLRITGRGRAADRRVVTRL